MTIETLVKELFRFGNARRKNLAGWMGTLGLAGIVFGLGASTAAINAGIILLLLGSVLALDDIVKDITLADSLLAGLLTAFLLLVTLWAIYHLRVDAKLAWSEFRGLVKIAGLPALAAGWWLLRGHLKYHHFLALLTLGIFIGCFKGIDIQRALHSPFAGRSIISDFNPNELGFLAGILFIISSISLLPERGSKSSLPGSDKLWNAFFLVTASLSGYLVITSQSRAVILGIVAAVASVFFLKILVTSLNAKGQGRRLTLIAASTLVIFSLVAFSPMGQVLVERFDGMGEALQLLAKGDMETVSGLEHSLKLRLMMWQESVSLITEAPLIGHGPGTAQILLAASSYTEIRHYNHFHNIWFHLLVVIGIVGALGFAALFLTLTLKSARDAITSDRPISWSLFGLWIYFLVSTLAQLRVNHPSGQAFLILIGGISCYCALETRQNSAGR